MTPIYYDGIKKHYVLPVNPDVSYQNALGEHWREVYIAVVKEVLLTLRESPHRYRGGPSLRDYMRARGFDMYWRPSHQREMFYLRDNEYYKTDYKLEDFEKLQAVVPGSSSIDIGFEHLGTELNLVYIKPGGYTCACCGKWFPSLDFITRHDDAVHGGARCTFLNGDWADMRGVSDIGFEHLSALSLDDQLIDASANGDLNKVKKLHKKGADIHADGDLALQMAAQSGELSVVRYLVEKGANIHADDDLALQEAAQNGRLDVVRYLVENHANIHTKDDEALRVATKNGHQDVVDYLKHVAEHGVPSRIPVGFEHLGSSESIYKPAFIRNTMPTIDRIVISAPHTVPDDSDIHMYDVVAAQVASLLGSRLKDDFPVEIIINRTEKRSNVDLNRRESRSHPYRRRIARHFAPDTLHIDVHSYPPVTPVFGRHDALLIAPDGHRTQLMSNVERAADGTGLDIRIMPYPSRKCDTTVHALEEGAPTLTIEVNEKFRGKEQYVASRLADALTTVLVPFKRFGAEKMLSKKEYDEAMKGEYWAINDYEDMIAQAGTDKEKEVLTHIKEEEEHHVVELNELIDMREFSSLATPPEKLSDWALIFLCLAGVTILSNIAGNR